MCEWNRRVLVQDLILAIVINTSATLLDGAPFDHTWYTFTCVAFATNVFAQLVIPTGSIASALTKWARDTPWRLYIQVFIENLIFVTIISLTEAFVHTGGIGIIEAWLPTYPWLALIGYVTSVLLALSARPKA